MSTVIELPKGLRSPLHRTANKGLMVQFINADLFNRGNLDVGKSIVFYDEHGVFEYAVAELPSDSILAQLRDQTAIRYWSKGIN